MEGGGRGCMKGKTEWEKVPGNGARAMGKGFRREGNKHQGGGRYGKDRRAVERGGSEKEEWIVRAGIRRREGICGGGRMGGEEQLGMEYGGRSWGIV